MSTNSLRRYLILQYLGDRLEDGLEFTTSEIVNLLHQYNAPYAGNQHAAVWNVLRSPEFAEQLKAEHSAVIKRTGFTGNDGRGGRSIVMSVALVPVEEPEPVVDAEVEEWMPA